MNENTRLCLEVALDEAYLKGYRDAKAGKESAVSFEAALKVKVAATSVPEEVKDLWSGKWLTKGGMFVEIVKDNVYKNLWNGSLYNQAGVLIKANIPYDNEGKTDFGEPFILKERLSNSNKENLWPIWKTVP